MEIDTALQQRITGLLSVLFPDAKIYLFGSRARKTHGPTSDIDLAIDCGKETDANEIEQAKAIMEALYIPVKVDVVDFHSISDAMQQAIMKEKVVWKQ